MRRLSRQTPVSTSLWATLVAWTLAAFSPAAALGETGWSIKKFDVLLKIEPDGTLDITETIDANFQVPKHGIFRDIPIRYAVGMHQYALPFQFRQVDDGAGHPYASQLTDRENRVQIRIGNAESFVQGDVRYRVRYRVLRAILFEGNRAWEKSDHARAVLRWVATGTEWGVPIARTVVTVELPRELDDAQVNFDAWTGAYGSRSKDFRKRRENARTLVFETGPFRPGEGITIEVSMPGDAVAWPSWWREASWWLRDNFVYALFPLAIAVCWTGWFLRGRDLPGQGTTVVNYEPPEGLGPAEVGTLIDESVNLRDISASIVDLAVRGYLKIAEQPMKSSPSSKIDYLLTRLKDPSDLKPFETKLFKSLFAKNADSVLLSTLESKLYPVIVTVKKDLYSSLSKHGYFDGNPLTVRTAYGFFGMLALVLMLSLAAVLQHQLSGRVFVVPTAITGVLSAIALLFTSYYMPRKTRKGRIAWEKIAGLEEYMRRAEIDDIKAQERQGIFERLLPYAIVFRIGDRWTKAFAGLYTQPPSWYQPVDASNFATWQLVQGVNQSVATMNHTFATVPRSAGTGGSGGPTGAGFGWSSGGFSGGGSSGGGFGGGGGGSW